LQTNSSAHSINARNKHHLLRPNVNLSCFQRSAYFADIRIFNISSHNLTSQEGKCTL